MDTFHLCVREEQVLFSGKHLRALQSVNTEVTNALRTVFIFSRHCINAPVQFNHKLTHGEQAADNANFRRRWALPSPSWDAEMCGEQMVGGPVRGILGNLLIRFSLHHLPIKGLTTQIHSPDHEEKPWQKYPRARFQPWLYLWKQKPLSGSQEEWGEGAGVGRGISMIKVLAAWAKWPECGSPEAPALVPFLWLIKHSKGRNLGEKSSWFQVTAHSCREVKPETSNRFSHHMQSRAEVKESIHVHSLTCFLLNLSTVVQFRNAYRMVSPILGWIFPHQLTQFKPSPRQTVYDKTSHITKLQLSLKEPIPEEEGGKQLKKIPRINPRPLQVHICTSMHKRMWAHIHIHVSSYTVYLHHACIHSKWRQQKKDSWREV